MFFPSWMWPPLWVLAAAGLVSAAVDFHSGNLWWGLGELVAVAVLVVFHDEFKEFADSRKNRVLAAAILLFGMALILSSVAAYFGFSVR